MSKTYILKKSLPDSVVGDLYIWNESMKAYYKGGNVGDSYWQKENVENNPEWFKLKEEEIDVFSELERLIKMYKEMAIHIRKQQYTEEDMRKCFEQGRLTNPVVGFKHKTFEDYLKTIK